MADITDVEDAIVNIVGQAVYPDGYDQPSVMPNQVAVSIARGWPLPACLDTSLAAGNAQITTYPLGGSALLTYQILDHTYVITPPAVTTTVAVAGQVMTVTGTLSDGEYLTLILDDAVVCSQSGANVAAMLSALATEAQGHGYTASSDATTLSVSFGREMVVRQGGKGVMGRVIHRQRASIMVCIWAPNDAIRTAAAILADVALKEHIKITMPDTSQCILRYQRTMSSDQGEKAMIYRRDLVYEAEYATVEQFPGYEITSTQISIQNLADNNSVNTVAIT